MIPPAALRVGFCLVAVLVALPAQVQAASSMCYITPSLDECKNFLLSDSQIWSDLNSTCVDSSMKNVTGWPAACSLRNACLEQSGGADCNPLSLLLAACNEAPTTTICGNYMGLCANGTVVPACLAAPTISNLSTAMSFYTSNLAMCEEMSMSACSSCTADSGDPDHVVIQEVHANCPDPLATMAALCLDMSMDGCANWTSFCSTNADAYPTLCSASSPSPSPSPTAAPSPDAGASPSPASVSPAAAPSPSADGPVGPPPPPASSGNSTWAVGGCYDDPGTSACKAFVQAASITATNITTLCESMPFMSGCTLRKQCDAGEASGTFCDGFSILASICEDMPGMNGCQGYNKLCSNSSSVVAQCTTYPAVPNLVMTYDAMDAVISACNDMPMEGCSDCTSRSACDDPLSTLAEVCLGMPDMSQCSGYQTMCAGAGAATFTTLCDTDGSADVLPPMRMYLHTAWTEIILFKGWVPQNKGEYIASCLALIFAAILVQFLKALRLRQEAIWAAQMRTSCCGPYPGKDVSEEGGACGGPAPVPGLWQGWLASWDQLQRNAWRSGFTLLVVMLDYALMLVVMTFNVGLVVSTILGFALGALVFGHIGETGSRAMSGPLGPDNQDDLEVQFVEPGSCCGNRQM